MLAFAPFPQTSVQHVLDLLQSLNLTPTNLILCLLEDPAYIRHPAVHDLLRHSNTLMTAFVQQPRTSDTAISWAHNVMKEHYSESIHYLASNRDNGWHFGALHASAQKLQDFRIEDMAREIKRLAPELWDLLDILLSTEQESKHLRHRDTDGDEVMRAPDVDEDADLWDQLENLWCLDAGEFDELGDAINTSNPRKAATRRKALIMMVCPGFCF